MHLCATAKGGLCHACSNNLEPCLYSLSGCINYVQREHHSRKRKACSSHDHTICTFDPKRSKLRCEVKYCPNSRDSASSSRCDTCRQGYEPCLERCGRRLTLPGDFLCSLCTQDTSDPSLRAAQLRATVVDTPWESCATPNCPYFVNGNNICALCATSCFPCSTPNCKRRSIPENGGKCTECLGLSFNPRPSSRSKAMGEVACVFSRVGCTNLASVSKTSAHPLCTSCHQSGYPCKFASVGCVQSLPVKNAANTDTCIYCLKHGAPCVGQYGNGCGHSFRKAGKKHPRRRAFNNEGCCLLCKPGQCSVPSCKRRVHTTFWSQRRCYAHGKLMSHTSSDGTLQHVQRNEASRLFSRASHSSSSFAARHKRKLQCIVEEPCCIRGCDQSARQCFFCVCVCQ